MLINYKCRENVCIYAEFADEMIQSSFLFCNFTAQKSDYIMKKNLLRLLLIVTATASAVSSCVRSEFRYSGYEDQLKGYFPVDSIEKGHKWNLIRNCTNFVKGRVPDAAKVQILSGNPFITSDVEVYAEVSTTSNISKQINYIAPEAQRSIYVGVLDKNGKYLRMTMATPFMETIVIDSKVPTGTSRGVIPQEIFYGFVADYPNPSDTWDYNDLVLSMKKRLVSETTVEVDVTLNAVGFLQQIGAAIRWVGKSYEEAKEKVERKGDATFMNAPEQPRLYFSGEWTDFQKARTGEFVINLFDDAHIAIYHLAEDGSVYRRYFNTMKNNGNTGAKATPKTVTYTFTFDNEVEARNFSLTELDPFIIVRYGTTGENFWEVHTYPYKLSEVLFPYYNGAARSYDNGFSWVVTVPYSKYRYPLEGIAIGEYKKDIITGAYQTNGHSFGEWVLNHNDAQDWFLYPADGAIY